MSEFQKEIERLKNEISILEGREKQIPTYSFSKIRLIDLEEIVYISKEFNRDKFNDWFDSDYKIDDDKLDFLENLLDMYGELLYSFNEESLKAYFIIPILNKINFLSIKERYSGLYDEPLFYKTDKFIFNGKADFIFAKGLTRSEKPYFFIQEFKQEKGASEPEPQLLAEMIAGLEISKVDNFKGVYIKGSIWRFVILEKLGKDKYQYFVSDNFDSSKIDDLRGIYSNLMFVKNKVIDEIKELK